MKKSNQIKRCECRVCSHYDILMRTSRIRNIKDLLNKAHTIDLVLRTDGLEKSFDGGFLKELF